MNSIKFYSRFTTDDTCYKYLSDIKWSGEEFVCKRCGHNNYCHGRLPYSRRCTRCKYDESPTSGTMFDKCKFSLLIAFQLAFKIISKSEDVSTEELSEECELRQKTCWAFKWKIQQAMQSYDNYLINETVYVDEFYVGGEGKGVIGSSKGQKQLVVVALEVLETGEVGRAYAQVIDDASAKSLRPFFHKHIDTDAIVVTDEWNGYKPLMKEYKHFEQHPSKCGAGLPEIQMHIMNIKSWLKGIHHQLTKERLQVYLDEYHFKYNRRNSMDTIFDTLINCMVENEPIRPCKRI